MLRPTGKHCRCLLLMQTAVAGCQVQLARGTARRYARTAGCVLWPTQQPSIPNVSIQVQRLKAWSSAGMRLRGPPAVMRCLCVLPSGPGFARAPSTCPRGTYATTETCEQQSAWQQMMKRLKQVGSKTRYRIQGPTPHRERDALGGPLLPLLAPLAGCRPSRSARHLR